MSDYQFDKPFFSPTVLHLVRGVLKYNRINEDLGCPGQGKERKKDDGVCLGGTHGCATIVGPG